MSDAQPTENWKDVEGFPGYQISDLGRLRSRRPVNGRGNLTPDWRIVRGNKDNKGYWRVILMKDGRAHAARIHQLVLGAFVGPRPPKMEGCHNDGNTDNNRLSNLRWDTAKGNAIDRRRHGSDLNYLGENHRLARLDEAAVRDIRRLHWSRVKREEILRKYPVETSVIWKIIRGKTWKTVPIREEDTYPHFLPHKLAQALVTAMTNTGLPAYKLAKKAGVDNGHLIHLKQGKRQPSWDIVCKLAAALGVEPESLCEERRILDAEPRRCGQHS